VEIFGGGVVKLGKMTEEAGQKDGMPSPVDTSIEAIERRFAERNRWRDSPQGKAVQKRGRVERMIKEGGVGKIEIQPQSYPQVVEGEEKNLEKIEQEISKLTQKEGFSKEDVGRLKELWDLRRELLIKNRMRLEELSGLGTERGVKIIPSVEEIGPEEYKREFFERLTSLIEENRKQSFDVRWQLIYPLEAAINALYPAYGKSDVFYYRGKSYSYSELRKELADQLEAFRAIHNYGYLHSKAAGVESLVEAANFLSVDIIGYLLKIPEIANTLRELEALGERWQAEESTSEKEKLASQIKQLISGNWKGIIAGNLFKALGEAARIDLVLDNPGDFFLARIYNASKKAKSAWEDDWKRKPFPELYQAVDLRVYPFWIQVLNTLRKRLIEMNGEEKGGEEFKVFCRQRGVEIREEDGRIISVSLRNAKFEDGLGLEKCPTNMLNLVYLEAADAENVRKAIFNPGGLLQSPSPSALTRINEVFKHLKGEDKYKWFARVIQAIVNYYKDTAFPDIDQPGLNNVRTSASKKDFPNIVPWTHSDIRSVVEGLSPMLRREDMNEVLKNTIDPNWKLRIEGKRVASAVGTGLLEGFKEFVKALLK